MNLPAKNASAGVASTHTVTLTDLDAGIVIDLTPWQPAVRTANLPAALWGAPLYDGSPPPSADLVPNLANGLTFTVPPTALGPSPGTLDVADMIDALPSGAIPLTGTPDPLPAPTADAAMVTTLQSTFAQPALLARQQALAAAIATLGAPLPTTGLLTQLAQNAGDLFVQLPLRAAVTESAHA